MANPFERRILYRRARMQLLAILLGTLMAYSVVAMFAGHLAGCFAAGVILGGMVVGGGMFTVIHELSHRGRNFQSALIREGAENHHEHHNKPDDPAHIRMSEGMWTVTLTLHVLLALPMPLCAVAGFEGLTVALLGSVLGSYVWFLKEEDGHVFAHTPFVQLTWFEQLQVLNLESAYHKGHHEPEDAERAERAPLALYAYQLWPEWVFGRRFYAALDSCMVTLERWGLLAA